MNPKSIEILSPAGDIERLISAIHFGADAVYLAGKQFGMRSNPSNFSNEELAQAVSYAHNHNVRVYLCCNTLVHNDELKKLPKFLKFAAECKVDAFIIADIGVFAMAQKYAPQVEIHISTQFGITNYETANKLYSMGAKRIVLARELSLDEIKIIRQNTPDDLEIEAFVHGAMCMSFSGRCMISKYLTNRDANRGDCAQPCRWEYALMERNRKGQYFPIEEDATGTYFFNSKDMCMIDHIPELIDAGITSLKIEGRAKSAYYTAVITNAYKCALNAYLYATSTGTPYKLKSWISNEVNMISHREYSTGFFFEDEPGQKYDSGGYIREYDLVAVCEHMDSNFAHISQRNKFFTGDTLNVLEPNKKPYDIIVTEMYDEYGNTVNSAPHAMQKLKIKTSVDIAPGALIRSKRK